MIAAAGKKEKGRNQASVGSFPWGQHTLGKERVCIRRRLAVVCLALDPLALRVHPLGHSNVPLLLLRDVLGVFLIVVSLLCLLLRARRHKQQALSYPSDYTRTEGLGTTQ